MSAPRCLLQVTTYETHVTGHRGFKQYLALAEQAKVVITSISEGPGKEWVMLADTYKGRVFPVYTEA